MLPRSRSSSCSSSSGMDAHLHVERQLHQGSAEPARLTRGAGTSVRWTSAGVLHGHRLRRQSGCQPESDQTPACGTALVTPTPPAAPLRPGSATCRRDQQKATGTSLARSVREGRILPRSRTPPQESAPPHTHPVPRYPVSPPVLSRGIHPHPQASEHDRKEAGAGPVPSRVESAACPELYRRLSCEHVPCPQRSSGRKANRLWSTPSPQGTSLRLSYAVVSWAYGLPSIDNGQCRR
jgi:hypothetical protein